MDNKANNTEKLMYRKRKYTSTLHLRVIYPPFFFYFIPDLRVAFAFIHISRRRKGHSIGSGEEVVTVV